MKLIDPKQGPRSGTFQFFKDFDNPYFNLCGWLDSTQLTAMCQDLHLGLSLPLFYLNLKAANAITVFKQRFDGEQVLEFPTIHGGSTVLRADESFGFCYFDFHPDFRVFQKQARLRFRQAQAIADFNPQDDSSDLIHFSVIPWFAFTSISHARRWRTRDSIPKITLGKNSQVGSGYQLPISVEVHHALMDGYHVGQFLQMLQNFMHEPSAHLADPAQNAEP